MEWLLVLISSGIISYNTVSSINSSLSSCYCYICYYCFYTILASEELDASLVSKEFEASVGCFGLPSTSLLGI
jgi:hypothetical protein